MKKIKYFIPSFLFMIIIFMFSQQTGEKSSGISNQMVIWIQSNLHITISEFFIRKAAHMSEYALLTFTFLYGYTKNGFSLKKVFIFSIFSTFIYACSDELHQLFIGGRAGQFTDVLIDTAGGIVAIGIFWIIYYIMKKKCSHS